MVKPVALAGNRPVTYVLDPLVVARWLHPILGTTEPATDYAGNPINWPSTPPYCDAGLVGQMEGAIAWHSPTTENPALVPRGQRKSIGAKRQPMLAMTEGS